MELDIAAPAGELTRALVDVASVSGTEGPLTDAVEKALGGVAGLTVDRDGDAVVARTQLGRPSRVVLAGHLDTVPIADNLPARRDGDRLYGCGTSDMKAGVAVMLHLAATMPPAGLAHDLTFVFYDNEEVEAARNGLRRLAARHRDWLDGDLAILMEPTSGEIEAGCQGTLRVVATLPGRRAHSARSWLGDNAIHRAGDLLTRLGAYRPRRVVIDGCEYREGLSAVRIAGGVAGNVIPDRCEVTVNFRFAPDRDEAGALDHVREVLAGYEVAVTDSAGGALPGLARPAAAEFVAATGRVPRAKYGWTDVARFAQLGIPGVNYGPGDPNLAHTRDEYVELPLVDEAAHVLRAYLTRVA
ncbi:succinyl-diaminopimelate desuccinylase [Frankia nepalensis]|uniref:succinyl-diaminopimelate desuccinylase n=1 Tax=Frankia nepalensis TaxID=1836974 RepID=UPI0019341B0F|nr:succinyl-diaminopimelate desuccinylase [Frankia nepalensis]MBL7501392.1 succinyl-diaminopimelate desuccinylase [Frankia nepalensis]MBL7511919.1 succinyl-diaminopimelate desuccinylase [Frankia nepalensis]